jgi:hypothetical protein
VGETSAPSGPCFGNTAAWGNSATDGDSAIAGNAQQCGAQLLANTNLGAAVTSAWQTIEKTASDTAKAAGATIVTAEGAAAGLTEILPALGANAVISELGDFLAGILGYIMQALTLGAVASVGTGATLGLSLGYIGVIVGAIIGAIVAAVNIISGGPSVQITNGATVKCTTYVQTNMPSAITWLTSQKTLQGFTPRFVADVFGLFLFNPVWGTINQGLLGMTFPNVPSAGTGDPVDQVYQLPGAFELLNRGQLAELCSILATSPGKLPFFASKPWAINLANHAGMPLAAAEAEAGAFAAPDQNPGDWQTVQFPLPTSEGPCTANCDYAVLGWPPGQRAAGATSYLYTACLNLTTNTNTVSGAPTNGNPGARTTVLTQSDISPAAYQAQVFYPSLTTDQCDQLFDVTGPFYKAYLDNFNAAQNWANTQPTLTAAQLQSGSQWNLTADDANKILVAWTERYSAVGAGIAAKGGTTSSAAASNAAQTASAAQTALASVAVDPLVAAATAARASGQGVTAVSSTVGDLSQVQSWGTFTGGSSFLGPALAAALATPAGQALSAKEAAIIPIAASAPPTFTLAQSQQLLQSVGGGDAVAKAIVNGTAASALAGDPVAVANLAVLSTAQKLQIQAAFVSHFVSPQAGNAILTGAHLA